jgi:hypothetical protein
MRSALGLLALALIASPMAALVGLLAVAVLSLPALGDDRLAGLPAAEARLRDAARKARVPYPLDEVELRVDKSERKLVLVSKGRAVRAYDVALGGAPEGHKQREGDQKTPEGDYSICTRNEKSRFHLFLGISYPAPRDAERALADGRIDEATAERVAGARSPAQPPWNTPLGGAVGVHGNGGKAAGDWTLGCIAVEDAEVDELWLACPLGTPIRIEP